MDVAAFSEPLRLMIANVEKRIYTAYRHTMTHAKLSLSVSFTSKLIFPLLSEAREHREFLCTNARFLHILKTLSNISSGKVILNPVDISHNFHIWSFILHMYQWRTMSWHRRVLRVRFRNISEIKSEPVSLTRRSLLFIMCRKIFCNSRRRHCHPELYRYLLMSKRNRNISFQICGDRNISSHSWSALTR